MNRVLKAALGAAAIAGSISAVALAQGQSTEREFGDDLFAAGSDVRIGAAGLEDVFAAGQTIVLAVPVSESAHLAGRTVRVEQAVGRDLYGAGSIVSVLGPVTGDVTAAGDEVEIAGSVGDDLIIAGRSVTAKGSVGGNATLFGETVEIAGVVTGSVRIRAENIRFGPAARIDGTLDYASENPVTVPASVISPDRVTAKKVTAESKAAQGVGVRIAEIAVGLVVMLVLGAIFAAAVPGPLARARQGVAARPWSHLLYGIVALSALCGAVLVFAISIIGLPLVLVMVLVIPLALLVGYLTAAHVLGATVLGLVRLRPGDGRLGAIASVAAGLVLLYLTKLIPVADWIIAVLAIAMGLGAWFVMWARPRGAVAAGAPSMSAAEAVRAERDAR